MPRAPDRRTGYASQPLALRRATLAVLNRAHGLTVDQIAAAAYWPGRPICRNRTPTCSASEAGSVRRALSALVRKGKVIVLHRDRSRRLVYGLANIRRDLDAAVATMTASMIENA